jgi:hypothetical protein
METKDCEHIARHRPILRRVQGIDGTELYTEELMLNYREQFERDFARTRARVINATEGGAAIRGAQNMPLRQALDEFCRQALDPRLFDYRRTTPWFDAAPLAAGQRQITSLIGDIRALGELCTQTLAILDDLACRVDRPRDFNLRIDEVEGLRRNVHEYERAYDVICAAAPLARLRRFVADEKLRASGTAGTERARRQLDRDREFVGTLRQEAGRMIAILEESLQRFDALTPQAVR